jgi:hypothetical protein
MPQIKTEHYGRRAMHGCIMSDSAPGAGIYHNGVATCFNQRYDGNRAMPESGLFLVALFLAVEERVTGSHRCETKTSWITVSNANAQCAQRIVFVAAGHAPSHSDKAKASGLKPLLQKN